MRRNPLPEILQTTANAEEYIRNEMAGNKDLIDLVRHRLIEELGYDAGMEEYEWWASHAATAYVRYARSAYAGNGVVIYRGMFLKSQEDVQLQNLGLCWSAVQKKAKPYDAMAFMRSSHDDDLYIFAAIVQPDDIDWEHGLIAYYINGDAEWEIRMRPNVAVKVKTVFKDIDGRVIFIHDFSPPILGNTGPNTGENWSGRCDL